VSSFCVYPAERSIYQWWVRPAYCVLVDLEYERKCIMAFNDIVNTALKSFPSLKISFKDTSLLMRILGTILFFTPGFMTKYITTIYPTIYFPTQSYINNPADPISASVVICHELTHCNDARNINPLLFGLLYLSPIILVIPALFLFLISWKLALPLIILFASPVPAYFRYLFEKRAYMVSLYANNAISKKYGWTPNFVVQEADIIEQFTTSAYYFMWPFKKSLTDDFDAAVKAVQAGHRPFNDAWFDTIDKLIAVA
jgi:hypothetical protein